MSKLIQQINNSNKKTVKLSDVSLILPGFAFKSNDFKENGTALVKITEIQSPYVVLNKCSHVDETKYDPEKLKKYFLSMGEYVIAMTGATIGKVGRVITNEPLLLNQRVAVVRPKPEFCRRFIESKLTSPSFQSYIKSIASGSSAQANISGDDIGDFKFTLPDLIIQKQIASILNAYDAKIENNNKIIKNLESTAQAIFNEWFVNFKFPGYEKVKMVESKLGKIPEGWDFGSVRSIFEINPSTKILEGSDVPYVEMRDLSESDMTFSFDQTRKPINGSKFKNHDTLIARITPCLENGKTGYVNCLKEEEAGAGSTEFIVLRPKEPAFREFSYLLARSKPFRDFAIGRMIGSSGRQRVSGDDIGRFEFSKPDSTIINKFHKTISPMFALVKEYTKENISLESQRDKLLTKLI
jgi:type I restriction enzyme S subunit